MFHSQLSDHDAILHLLSHLYAHRSSSLWKIPEHASWFKDTVKDTLPSIGKAGSQEYSKRFVTQFQSSESSTLKRSICRHASLLSDANASRRLTSFFPRSVLRGSTNLSCDPLPPETAITRYDDAFFEGSEDIFAYRPRTRREQELDAQNMNRVVPDVQRRQLLMVRERNDFEIEVLYFVLTICFVVGFVRGTSAIAGDVPRRCCPVRPASRAIARRGPG